MFAFTYILSVIKDVETQKNIMLQEHRAENKEVVCCVCDVSEKNDEMNSVSSPQRTTV